MRRREVILICSIFILFSTFYIIRDNSTNNKEIVYNGNNLRISVDGESTTNLPNSGNYYLVDYECKSDDTILTWDRTTYQLKVTNGNKKGGVACYLDFQSNPKLSDMETGSYVAYTGNNGCSGEACSGQNVNYMSTDDMGYCYNSVYKFTVNGWRLGYVSDGSPYLISGGSPECMCTDSSGNASTSCSNYETTSGVPLHLANLNNKALKYCNQDYAYGGVCNSTSSWNMNAVDFQNITGKALSSSSCFTKSSDKSCGYTNDLIDNGGYYWIAIPSSDPSYYTFDWLASSRYVDASDSSYILGVRPVLRLESSVLVAGGSGTYEDPYMIANNTFFINDTNVASNEEERQLTLNMLGYNVSTMCVSLNTSGCSNYVPFSDNYTLSLVGSKSGENIIFVYYKDESGKIIASMDKTVTLQ